MVADGDESYNYRTCFGPVVVLLAEALAVLFYDGFRHAFSVGGMYFVLSLALNLTALVSLRLERKRALGLHRGIAASSPLLKAPQSSLSVLAAYITFFLSVLNVLTLMPDGSYEWPVVITSVCASACLFYAMIKIPGQTFERGEGAVEFWPGIPVRPSYAYAVFVIFVGTPILTALLHMSYYALHTRVSLPVILRPPGASLISIALLSTLFAALLFRPRKQPLPGSIKKKAVIGAVVFIGLSFTAEISQRQNWYLYALSLLSILGRTAGSMRLWTAISRVQRSGTV